MPKVRTRRSSVHDVHRVLVVGVGKDHELGHEGKALEGKLQFAHAAVVIQMVVVDVQHNGQIGVSLRKVSANSQDSITMSSPLPACRSPLMRGSLPPMTADGSRPASSSAVVIMEVVVVFSVSAGDADALFVQAAQVTQQNAALDGGDAVGGSGIQLHVIFGNGGRVTTMSVPITLSAL